MYKLVLLVLLMKKTAITQTMIICALFSLLAVEFQATTFLVKGNPSWGVSTYVQVTYPEAGNNTYYSNTLTVNYTVDFSYVEHRLVAYSLDGGENVTIYENYPKMEVDPVGDINGSVTLTGLSDGHHIVEIFSYGSFWFRPVDSTLDSIDFWINPSPRPTATPDPTPIAENLILVSSVAIALVIIGLLVYSKKRKH